MKLIVAIILPNKIIKSKAIFQWLDLDECVDESHLQFITRVEKGWFQMRLNRWKGLFSPLDFTLSTVENLDPCVGGLRLYSRWFQGSWKFHDTHRFHMICHMSLPQLFLKFLLFFLFLNQYIILHKYLNKLLILSTQNFI